jgi:hypothetical protein
MAEPGVKRTDNSDQFARAYTFFAWWDVGSEALPSSSSGKFYSLTGSVCCIVLFGFTQGLEPSPRRGIKEK